LGQAFGDRFAGGNVQVLKDMCDAGFLGNFNLNEFIMLQILYDFNMII
jgi:hypothetical protein